MTLLKTREYIDLVDLSRFLAEEYGMEDLGESGSFHRLFSEAMGYPGQSELVYFEMLDEDSWNDYNEEYQEVVRVFNRLVAAGHLPKRDGYSVEVWW